jgi:GntR family transcriptional regulator / MocR family aminotransferase
VPDDWAISGRDLHLDLSRSGRRVGLERALREAVQSGRLAPGTVLPPSRALASDLGIARNTVAEAYTQLVAEGWLTARQGSGTRVTGPPAPTSTVSLRLHHGESAFSARPMGLAGAPADAAYDLRAGFPDVAAFPYAEWLAAARTALGRTPSSAYRYPDPQGLPELRTALAGYLARTRGVRATPERVVVCGGFGQGLWALAAALHRLGARRAGVESHGLPLHRRILTEAGMTLVGLPVGASGAELPTADPRPTGAAQPSRAQEPSQAEPPTADPRPTGAAQPSRAQKPSQADRAADGGGRSDGERAGDPGDLDLVLLTPAHQFPLGTALDAEHRAAFVRWAGARGAVLVEDDYDGEFRYDRRPLGAMQALAPDDVVYGGTASKALAPAVGLAWLVLPERLVEPVVAELTRVGARPAALNQFVLAEFLTSGRYDRHVRRSRLAYRRRRDRLVAALTGLPVHGLPAGLHAVVDLPHGRTEEEAVAEARRRGLAIEGLAAFALTPDDRPPALVVGYASPPAHAFTTAVARLVATLRAL